MISWDQAIIHELKVLGIHSTVQFILFLILSWMAYSFGFPGGDIVFVVILLVAFSTVNQDLITYTEEGPSVLNNVARAGTNIGSALLTEFILTFLCKGQVRPDNKFEIQCNEGTFASWASCFLFNLLLLAIIRSVITTLILLFQLFQWAWNAAFSKS